MSTPTPVFIGRRPLTPVDKTCVNCGTTGRIEADTDGAGNTIDRCVKCGKPYQPRGTTRVPSPTSPAVEASSTRRTKAKRGKRPLTGDVARVVARANAKRAGGKPRGSKRRGAAPPPSRKRAAASSGETSLDQAVALLERELSDLDEQREGVQAAIDALQALGATASTNGHRSNGGRRK